jgi:hypothetical protein
MYSTCLFCNADLESNQAIEHFPVGKRLAFDAAKGRLWVVCLHCQRWNLTPIEERWEAIEECERLYRATLTRVSTDNVGLAVLRGGLDLVRIGEPRRPEFAAWRYAGQFAVRHHRSRWLKGATVAATAAASVAIGTAMPAVTLGLGVLEGLWLAGAMTTAPILGILAANEYMQNDRVVARFTRRRHLLTVRARHVSEVALEWSGPDARLAVPHDDGSTTFAGMEATHAATVILANSNRYGGARAVVDDAVRQIEDAGSVEHFMHTTALRTERRNGGMLATLANYRGLGTMKLSLTECLALEMAVHEETERRAMDGELEFLRDAWRHAEEIAEICDGMLTPASASVGRIALAEG